MKTFWLNKAETKADTVTRTETDIETETVTINWFVTETETLVTGLDFCCSNPGFYHLNIWDFKHNETKESL